VALDSTLAIALGVLLVVVALWAVFVLSRALSVRRRGIERIGDEGSREPLSIGTPHAVSWLARWLGLAGFTDPRGPMRFAMCCAASFVVGTVLAVAFNGTVLDSMIQVMGNIPGGVGEAFVAILKGGPWIVFVIVAVAPVLYVRAARRTRVREIERDLPLTLELFATLAEAGLGFDAALSRIVRSQTPDRPLRSAFVAFQRDVQGGVPRLTALRRLADRLDVMSMTIFVSAVVQSEQVGASLAETLRHQADDLRERRREHALLLSQALPVKLVFPLVACFLPGVFLSTLGPVLYQMIQVADSVLRSGGR
jgi:tight adherence protein C